MQTGWIAWFTLRMNQAMHAFYWKPFMWRFAWILNIRLTLAMDIISVTWPKTRMTSEPGDKTGRTKANSVRRQAGKIDVPLDARTVKRSVPMCALERQCLGADFMAREITKV